ncbi:MAG TPA: glycosyl hydrolase [Terriglobia bacterium]|nr:glycosyl hydrolase [Terriglobia bacterium]
MHRQRLKRAELLVLGVLFVSGAGLCRFGPGHSPSQTSESTEGSAISTLEANFRFPPEDSKIMVRWWWFGPAVTTEELDREMQAMKDAGIGGFEVATVYPLAVDDPGKGLINLRFLSPEHLTAVGFAARRAHELGLRMDMTMGSGWPYGGPHITPDLAAEGLRCLRIPIPAGRPSIPGPPFQEGQRFLAAFVAGGSPNHFDAQSAQLIAPEEDGSFQLPPSPGGPRVLLIFVAALTGQQVKRAAVGAEGNVLDHYARAAAEKHLEAVGAPLAAAGNGNLRAMFCDSLEVYGSDWTPGFLSEFQRRRGYDLKPFLPALFAEPGPQTAAVRHDWGETLTELFDQNFLAPYQSWCREHHILARVQAYGTPPAQLSSYRFADLPEGEQGDEAGHWNHFTASRWASSAGHLYGVPVISAEAWTWIHWLPFRATPLDFKAYSDHYFLEGINQLIGHGWPYSPPGVPEPGWHLYAAGALNPHNPWWFAMPDLALYLQRASFMLRQGRPANDVAVYLPTHDAWADLTPGNVNLWEAIWRKLGPSLLPTLLEAGYNLDFIDDETLAQQGRVEKGKLMLPGQDFSIVVMPGIERIPPESLSKLGEFAKSGGILVATRRLPQLQPGLHPQLVASEEVPRLVERIFTNPSGPGHFVPKENQSLQHELNRLYPPDVAFSPRSQDVGFIHRHTESAEIYFIANTSNRRYQGTATFHVKGKNAEYWDLFTGEVRTVPARSGPDAPLILDLEPYGSRLVVLSDRKLAEKPATKVPNLPEPLDISRGWQVTFEGNGKEVSMETLRSWTELEGMQYYSGRAAYLKKVNVPAGFLQEGVRARLDVGEGTPLLVQKSEYFQVWLSSPVREAAEVYVNGRRAGVIWHPPFELDVAALLRPGVNEFRIMVGNLAVNSMAGKPLPDRSQLNARYGQRFEDQGNNLIRAVPSGLTGPIRLVARQEATAGVVP